MDSHALVFRLKADLESSGLSLLQTPGVDARITSTTPPEFPGGKAGIWSPEALLLGAVAGCFINTFQVFAEKLKLEFDSFSCEATGTVERVDGKFMFTGVTLHPTIVVDSEAAEAQAASALDKAHRYCLVSNSLKCPVILEQNIRVVETEGVN